MITKKQILELARTKISDPNRWIRDRIMELKHVDGHMLMCYCSIGAIRAAKRDLAKTRLTNPQFAEVDAEGNRAEDHLQRTCFSMHRMVVPDFNDLRSVTHGEILQLFDKAIETA